MTQRRTWGASQSTGTPIWRTARSFGYLIIATLVLSYLIGARSAKAQSPCSAGNNLQDPGFEASSDDAGDITNPAWDSSSTVFGTSLCNTAECGDGGGTAAPRTWNYWVWFGGTNGPESGTVSQVVAIPTGATATLNYYLRIGGVEAPFTDVLRVIVDGTTVQTVSEPSVAEADYHLRQVNLNAYADGQGHTISFQYDSPSGGGIANFSIDDVMLDLVCPGPSSPPQLANISTRLAVASGDNVLIGGCIIAGTQPKKVIVRAIGPSLSALGVSGALADPMLELHDGSGALIASNDNWQVTQLGGIISANQIAEIQNSGVAPTNAGESAIIATLAPGAYTAVVRGKANSTGVALVEVYDLARAVDSKLVNISTRGFVQTGDNVLIGGVIVVGTNPATLVIRALGPSLTQAGVANALADPTLELYDGNGTSISFNDDWLAGDQRTSIESAGLAPLSNAESAIVTTVSPGAYTAIVRGKDNHAGVGLIEVYDVTGPVAPFSVLYLSGAGFDPTADVSVRFFDNAGYDTQVPVIAATTTRLAVVVPAYQAPISGEIGSGTVNWQVIQETATSRLVSPLRSGLQIQNAAVIATQPGQVMLSLLHAVVQLANSNLTDIVNTPWNTQEIRTRISSQISNLNALITNIENLRADAAKTFVIGSASGVPITIGQSDLAKVDRLLVRWLRSISGTSLQLSTKTASPVMYFENSGAACTESQASNFAQAATQGDPQLDKLAQEFVYAPRHAVVCGTPAAFDLTFKNVGGAAGIGIGLILLAAAPEAALMAAALPSAALLYVVIAGASGEIAIGGALNQTSDAARQLVANGVQTLEHTMYGAAKAVIPTWTGGILATGLGSKSLLESFSSATIGPQPTPTPVPSPTAAPTPTPTPAGGSYNGVYIGSFSGQEVCPGGDLPVDPAPFAFTVTNGVVSPSGGVDSNGHIDMTVGLNHFIGTIVAGHASGTWTAVSGECSFSGSWFADRQ